MKAGTLLFVLRDIVDYLEKSGNLLQDGSFGDFSLAEDVQLTTVIIQSLEKHGVTLPTEVDKVLSILPLVITLVK